MFVGIFVGNTYIRIEDVRSKYSRIENEYNVGDIISGEEKVDDLLICKTDFENIINNIYNDVDQIIKMLIDYDTSNAIDELKILAEKLY